MLKFGISEEGFRRLLALFKEGIEYTDDWEESWEEEYGEDWGAEDYAQPEPSPEETYGIASEDLIKGSIILAAMGMDVENMEDSEISLILKDRPSFLELVPQFNVQGQWVHTLREHHIPSLAEEIQNVVSSDKELCVTAGESAEFWNFSEYRIVAVVLEGTCKILWNADMFSHFSEAEGKLVKSISSQVEFLNEMTEGWIVPAECTFVGLKVNWEKLADTYKGNFPKAKEQLEGLAQTLGVSIVESESLEKVLGGFEVVEAEEAMDYGACEVDLESPEHLYEPYGEEYQQYSYQEHYSDQLVDAVNDQDAAAIQELLDNGATLEVKALEKNAFANSLINSNVSPEIFGQLVQPAFSSQEALENIFRAAIWEGRFDYAEVLVDGDYTASSPMELQDVFEFLILLDEPPLDLMRKAFAGYKGSTLSFILDNYGADLSPEVVSFLINDLEAKLRPSDLNKYSDRLVKTIAQVAPDKMNALIKEQEEKAAKYPDMAPLIEDFINELKQKIAG